MKTSRRLARTLLRWLLPLMALGVIVSGVLFLTGVFSYQIYIIHTGSMTPTIPTRSAVIVHEGPVQVGQVVTFHTEGGVVAHRLVKQLPDGTYQTKGDANETVDVGTIGASQIIGPVVAAPRNLGYWLAYFKSQIGLGSLALGILCLWLMYSVLVEFGAAGAARRRSWTRRPGTRVGAVLVMAGLAVVLFAGTAQADFEARVSGTMRGTLDPSFATSDSTTTTVLDPTDVPETSSSTTAGPTTSTSETTSTEPTELPATEPPTTAATAGLDTTATGTTTTEGYQ